MKSQTSIFKRQIINNPRLQFGVTAFFVILATVNLVFFIVLLKVLESKILHEINQLNEDSRRYLLEIFNSLSNAVFQSSLFFGAFIIIFSFFGGVVLLQHITGPTLAIKKFLSDMVEGKSPRYPLKFRKHDFFNDHAELLNELYEKYELKKKKD